MRLPTKFLIFKVILLFSANCLAVDTYILFINRLNNPFLFSIQSTTLSPVTGGVSARSTQLLRYNNKRDKSFNIFISDQRNNPVLNFYNLALRDGQETNRQFKALRTTGNSCVILQQLNLNTTRLRGLPLLVITLNNITCTGNSATQYISL